MTAAAEQEAADAAQRVQPRARQHPLLHLLIAISIGLVSVLGAVVLWRSETHASNASAADSDAIGASITGAHLRSTAEEQAQTAQRQFTRYERLGLDAARLDPGYTCDNRDPRPSTITQLDARVDCEVRLVFSGYANETSRQGGYDVTRYARDVQAFDRYFHPESDPAPFEAVADHQRHLEHELLWLSLGLVVVLALFTSARLRRSTAAQLALAVPGWALCAAAAVALVVVEL